MSKYRGDNKIGRGYRVVQMRVEVCKDEGGGRIVKMRVEV